MVQHDDRGASLTVRSVRFGNQQAIDLDAAVTFYRDVVGGEECYDIGPLDARDLPKEADGRDWTDSHLGVPDAHLSCRAGRIGSFVLELFCCDRPDNSATVPPRVNDLGGGHIALLVDDVEAAAVHLQTHGVAALQSIEVPPEASSGAMRCRYFTDPWGNTLELISRP